MYIVAGVEILKEALEIAHSKKLISRMPLLPPVEWLTDNGSCYIADETRSFASSLGFKICTTPVHSSQSNGMAEAFVTTFKRDYVYLNDRPDAATVLAKLAERFED